MSTTPGVFPSALLSSATLSKQPQHTHYCGSGGSAVVLIATQSTAGTSAASELETQLTYATSASSAATLEAAADAALCAAAVSVHFHSTPLPLPPTPSSALVEGPAALDLSRADESAFASSNASFGIPTQPSSVAASAVPTPSITAANEDKLHTCSVAAVVTSRAVPLTPASPHRFRVPPPMPEVSPSSALKSRVADQSADAVALGSRTPVAWRLPSPTSSSLSPAGTRPSTSPKSPLLSSDAEGGDITLSAANTPSMFKCSPPSRINDQRGNGGSQSGNAATSPMVMPYAASSPALDAAAAALRQSQQRAAEEAARQRALLLEKIRLRHLEVSRAAGGGGASSAGASPRVVATAKTLKAEEGERGQFVSSAASLTSTCIPPTPPPVAAASPWGARLSFLLNSVKALCAPPPSPKPQSTVVPSASDAKKSLAPSSTALVQTSIEDVAVVVPTKEASSGERLSGGAAAGSPATDGEMGASVAAPPAAAPLQTTECTASEKPADSATLVEQTPRAGRPTASAGDKRRTEAEAVSVVAARLFPPPQQTVVSAAICATPQHQQAAARVLSEVVAAAATSGAASRFGGNVADANVFFGDDGSVPTVDLSFGVSARKRPRDDGEDVENAAVDDKQQEHEERDGGAEDVKAIPTDDDTPHSQAPQQRAAPSSSAASACALAPSVAKLASRQQHQLEVFAELTQEAAEARRERQQKAIRDLISASRAMVTVARVDARAGNSSNTNFAQQKAPTTATIAAKGKKGATAAAAPSSSSAQRGVVPDESSASNVDFSHYDGPRAVVGISLAAGPAAAAPSKAPAAAAAASSAKKKAPFVVRMKVPVPSANSTSGTAPPTPSAAACVPPALQATPTTASAAPSISGSVGIADVLLLSPETRTRTREALSGSLSVFSPTTARVSADAIRAVFDRMTARAQPIDVASFDAAAVVAKKAEDRALLRRAARLLDAGSGGAEKNDDSPSSASVSGAAKRPREAAKKKTTTAPTTSTKKKGAKEESTIEAEERLRAALAAQRKRRRRKQMRAERALAARLLADRSDSHQHFGAPLAQLSFGGGDAMSGEDSESDDDADDGDDWAYDDDEDGGGSDDDDAFFSEGGDDLLAAAGSGRAAALAALFEDDEFSIHKITNTSGRDYSNAAVRRRVASANKDLVAGSGVSSQASSGALPSAPPPPPSSVGFLVASSAPTLSKAAIARLIAGTSVATSVHELDLVAEHRRLAEEAKVAKRTEKTSLAAQQKKGRNVLLASGVLGGSAADSRLKPSTAVGLASVFEEVVACEGIANASRAAASRRLADEGMASVASIGGHEYLSRQSSSSMFAVSGGFVDVDDELSQTINEATASSGAMVASPLSPAANAVGYTFPPPPPMAAPLPSPAGDGEGGGTSGASAAEQFMRRIGGRDAVAFASDGALDDASDEFSVDSFHTSRHQPSANVHSRSHSHSHSYSQSSLSTSYLYPPPPVEATVLAPVASREALERVAAEEASLSQSLRARVDAAALRARNGGGGRMGVTAGMLMGAGIGGYSSSFADGGHSNSLSARSVPEPQIHSGSGFFSAMPSLAGGASSGGLYDTLASTASVDALFGDDADF